MEKLEWGALPEGVDPRGEPLFIARGAYKDGLHPGKAGPQVPNGGQTKWVPAKGKANSEGIFVEGGREANGTLLYIAKAATGRSVEPGKAGTHLNGISYAMDDREQSADTYMVLSHAKQ
ncbi:hypothetical protein BX070DRAFT_255639 [Coemansia spiralis]|nr:hypothetical protein BX070DRAFT_255639 [Coemansia spiralis]